MAHGCLKCLKYTMCVTNFLCFMCGVSVLSFGIYLMAKFRVVALIPELANFNIANMLMVSGIIITCVSFLGFLGALKENRCLLLMYFLLLFLLMVVELTAACLLLVSDGKIESVVEETLVKGLEEFDCCGVKNESDWGNKVPTSCCKSQCTIPRPPFREKGCYKKLKIWVEDNFLTIGISVIALCVIEVLGMCFAMTLYCHISKSGLGYKL
ncbi:leukocyte surface antigen CD53-like isoform X2 [Cynoglossus semilaevis]|uniref:leukocyte surface antigen CD53-like isoform X2 n=1 Tax=Cynoglossus semilaevis TaxID=244447 RepID=UPI000D626657|nr:leukocyte surface antigen CD53-like isoform X2 [Cynoglossus semilaevis]